jgi:hypothetical protein
MQLFELVQTLFELFQRQVEFIVIPRELRRGELQCATPYIYIYSSYVPRSRRCC